MPDRTRPPFRANHIGSLKRTPELLQARAEFNSGKISKDQIVQLENEAIKSAIALQRKVGHKAITDGEYRRAIFFDGFFERLEGIEVTHGLPLSITRAFVLTPAIWMKPSSITAPLVAGKLKRTKPIYVPEFESIKDFVEESDIPNIKITMCSPLWFDFRFGKKWIKEGCNTYASRAELLDDLSAIYRSELADLYAAGCRNVQIDEPSFTFFCYQPIIDGFKEEGIDSFALLEEYIDMFNDCLRDVPEDMMVGVHLCRGNFRGKSFVEGSYDPVAKQLFSRLNVKCFYLEYDTQISGGFEPLVHLPKEKIAVLGLISTKKPEMESPELLVSRIEEAVRIIKDAHPERTHEDVLDQLCLSPQCGFASEMMGNPITMEDMENKLKLVADVSRRVWNY